MKPYFISPEHILAIYEDDEEGKFIIDTVQGLQYGCDKNFAEALIKIAEMRQSGRYLGWTLQ